MKKYWAGVPRAGDPRHPSRRLARHPVRLRRALALSVALLGATVGVAAAAGEADGLDVRIPAGSGPSAVDLAGRLFRPATDRPAPAIVALHGCGGLWTRSGRLAAREAAWARELVGRGWVVLFPDGFGSRGVGEQCTTRARTVRAGVERVADVRASFDWLAAQPFVRPEAIGLLGWSNGGSTTLAALAPAARPATGDFAVAVAFYPGCRPYARAAGWRARLDLEILIGEADDWTAAADCRALVAAHPDRVALHTYPGARHGFDHPSAPLRERRGLAFTARGDGIAHTGTDPAARADAIVRVGDWFAAHFAPAAPAPVPPSNEVRP